MFEYANKKNSALAPIAKPKEGFSFDDVQINYNSDKPAQSKTVQRVEFDEEEELLQGKFSDTIQREALDLEKLDEEKFL
jgi:hypothetical protein